MIFNSFEFIFLFLPCVVLGYHLLQRLKLGQRNLALDWLILCSLFFYAWGNPNNFPILLGSLFFNYAMACWMGAAHSAKQETPSLKRKYILIFSILANLLFLSYYKYLSALPLGVSFFTLMQVMYLVDCFEGMITPNTLREHALLVSFFPTVTMGPILRTKEFLSQFTDSTIQRTSADQIAPAILLFTMGLFKKAVIADNFARIADAGYSSTATLSMLEGWMCSIAYSVQLYFDFSGYSDMAVASALFLGINIPINFNSPYQARSIVDFWKRWHISLSNFITTYLYTPIVRSFKQLTFKKAMWSTFVSMLIAGLWHGAGWGFIIFGALHGIGLVINQYRKKAKKKLPDLLAWGLTLAYINFTFIFFRAHTLSDAFDVLRSFANIESIVGMETLKLSIRGADMIEMSLPLLMGCMIIFCKKNSNQIVKEFRPTNKNLLWSTLAMFISLIYLNSNIGKEFLYFDF